MFRRAVIFAQRFSRHTVRNITTPTAEVEARIKLCTQVSNSLLMVQPANFSCNPLTKADNTFQDPSSNLADHPQQKALSQFHQLVSVLRSRQISVKVYPDTPHPVKPDAIFPNNWLSSHPGELVLYPMRAENRRTERRMDVVDEILKTGKKKLIDLTRYEAEGKFLEGTGSLVLDRVSKKAYVCLSPRTDMSVVQEFCSQLSYRPIVFSASYRQVPFYHTNVMMSVGLGFSVVCLESIPNQSERELVVRSLSEDRKEIIEISGRECGQLLGNCLQVRNKRDELFIIMSETARAAMEAGVQRKLERHGTLISSDISTIEALGGGSARCMILELFNSNPLD